MNISNKKILDFYKAHPLLDFEKINVRLIDLFEQLLLDTNEKELINNHIFPLNYSTLNHNTMDIILSKLFPSDEIINDTLSNCDYLLKRYNNPNVIFKCVDFFKNVDNNITDMFVSSIKEKNSCGVFISQNSGILNKPNYHIEIFNGNVLIYLQHCNYNCDNIQNAINIIDMLYKKLKHYDSETSIEINKDVLCDINNEYQCFINHKEITLNLIKEQNKTLINHIDKFNFPNLEKYLSIHCINKETKKKYVCDICDSYTSYTLKGIAAHKKGCKRKNIITSVV
jgi:hypothetical protein